MTPTDELLERVAHYFSDVRHWMKAGWYNDDQSQHCLVGAIDFLGQKYELPAALVKWLIFDAIVDEQDRFYVQLYNLKDIDWFIINYNDRCSTTIDDIRQAITIAQLRRQQQTAAPVRERTNIVT